MADDYVAEENPVLVVDVFVDDLDLGALTLRASRRRRRAAVDNMKNPSPRRWAPWLKIARDPRPCER
jgi:hypothetical protein